MSIRSTTIFLLGIGFLVGCATAQETSLGGEKEKLSYALGVKYGNGLKKESIEVDPALFKRGLEDALSNSKMLLTEEEIRQAVTVLQDELKSKRSAAQAEKRLQNAKEGEAFLAGNKTRDGVVTLPTGLQYRILKEGAGMKPTLNDTVVCHYRGSLIDGTEFDSSHKRNQPASLPLKKLIKGWRDALQLMPVGSKWQLFVPPSLAYGERGAGGVIGPNATLIFEVDLVSIKAAAAGKNNATKQADPIGTAAEIKPEQPPESTAASPAIGGIRSSFKLDPRLMGGTYGGERWVSPATYTGASAQDTVETRVEGTDAQGRPVKIRPTWTPADPEMVTVSPSEGNLVKITVKHAGESSLEVASNGISRKLSIKAKQQGNAMQVEIAQQ